MLLIFFIQCESLEILKALVSSGGGGGVMDKKKIISAGATTGHIT